MRFQKGETGSEHRRIQQKRMTNSSGYNKFFMAFFFFTIFLPFRLVLVNNPLGLSYFCYMIAILIRHCSGFDATDKIVSRNMRFTTQGFVLLCSFYESLKICIEISELELEKSVRRITNQSQMINEQFYSCVSVS